MGPNIPSFTDAVAGNSSGQGLGKDITNLAPLATTWHGAQTGVNAQQVLPTASRTAPGVLSKFQGFLGNIFSETGHIIGGAATWLAHTTVDMAEAPIHYGEALGHGIVDQLNLNSINAQNQQLSDRVTNLQTAFKAGRLDAKQYSEAMFNLSQDFQNLSKESTAIGNKATIDQKAAVKATLDTASALVTVLTAGLGAPPAAALTTGGVTPLATKTAGEWLASTAAKPFLDPATDFIAKTISSPEVFKSLSPAAQEALQRSTAEVVAQGGRMTAGQIAKATATNLALKYPLYYGATSQTADQLYAELDQKKYGDAVQTLAFNAALLLTGGPIGQAMKFGGKALSGVSAKTFGKTSFWDELSKYYGDQTPGGFRNAVAKATADMSEAEKSQYLRNLSAVEATNIGAAGDAVGAARRVATGLTANEGVDLKTITHEEALKNMVNFAEAQRLADSAAQEAGLGRVAVGRVDARQLNTISATLSAGLDTEGRLQAWETMKQQNPSQAWANNPNLDRQIKNLIQKHEDATSLDTAIRGIKAQFNVEGFPSAVSKKLSKMGYIPIKPVINEAPFKEGAGVITSKFAQEGDVWTKAVQPLPILGSVGNAITALGLSPQNATQRVYQIYNQNLAENLTKTAAFGKLAIHGDTPEQTSDTIIKRLSDFAHNPSRGGFGPNHLRPPITDMRQLTTKDIETALGVSTADAREVAGSLMDSMLQVPLQVRGLGDRVADINYKINPTAKAYARIQGATRFSWNPFFQAKLAYKTESISQLETHGKLPTVAGTNKIMSVIFPEHYNKLNDIRETLRTHGIFDEKASFGEIVGGEGVNDAGAAGANLTHKLLPSQEISIAGVVATQADKMGQSVDEFVKNFPTQVRDSVQAIAQYDRNAQFLNSPLARTLNLAFFPFRFETKVAGFMARSLATTSTMTQFAVIKGLYNGSNFLKSPQGQVWYSQNSDVIKLLTYFTPVTTLSYFATALGGKPDSVGAFGELGGLPLGWIPQLLDAEGLTHITQSAYLDPKTGNEIPGYVPATDRGSLLVAVQDLIGQLFTYPGAAAGLPSKTSLTRQIAMGVTGGKKNTDLQQSGQLPLSPEQQSFQQAVQAANPQPAQQQSTTKQTQLNKPVPGISVPAGSSPLTTPIPKKVGGSGGAKKKKKADFTPQLLPGQTQLGSIPGVN